MEASGKEGLLAELSLKLLLRSRCPSPVHRLTPSKRPAAHIASVREKAAGIKWERELSEIEVDAGTPEGERTPVETYAFPPEDVPEAGPTFSDRSRAPRAQRSGRSARSRLQRSSRRLPSAGPEFSERGSSQSGWESEITNEDLGPTTAKPTAEYVRSRLREMKGKIMKEPRRRRELCRLVAERTVDRTVEALAYREAARETRRKATQKQASSDKVDVREQPQQRCKRHRGREPRSATGRSTSGALCQ